MENKNKRNLSPSNNIKSKSLKTIDKNQNKPKPLNQSVNAKILNKLGIILSPSSYLSRNSDKDILSIRKFKEKEKTTINSKMKLTKSSKKSSILPNISIQRNKKIKNTFLYPVKSTQNFKNKILQNNFSNNKTINSFFQTPKVKNEEEKNKIRKISTAFLLNKSTNITDTNTQNKNDNKKIITSIHKKNKKEIKIKNNNTNNDYNYTDINLEKLIKETKFYSPKRDNNNKTLIDDFLSCKNGIFNLSDFNRKLLCKNLKILKPAYKKNNTRNLFLNKIRNKNFFSQIKKDNDLMKQKIKKEYNSLKELKNKYYLQRPNENTYEGFSKIYYKYNKDRSKKNNICTNRLIALNWAGDNSLDNIDYKEKAEKFNKTKLNNVFLNSKGQQIYNYDQQYKNKKLTTHELANLCYRANQKVEKIFPDMLAFNLPKVFRDNKTYTIKLLYDVFIEFKTLLKFNILFNRNVNIHNKGIDFDTFYNCNSKIKQQGEGLSKKIFKTLNNKVEKQYLPWGNYLDGMMKMKDPDINNKMDLFFEILDENGDGSLDYEEVYNLSLVSLQRTISHNPSDILRKTEKEKKNQKEVIGILAEFFSNMIFSLVNIDVNDEIPIDVLKNKMKEGGEAAEYLEMFLCADNFA